MKKIWRGITAFKNAIGNMMKSETAIDIETLEGTFNEAQLKLVREFEDLRIQYDKAKKSGTATEIETIKGAMDEAYRNLSREIEEALVQLVQYDKRMENETPTESDTIEELINKAELKTIREIADTIQLTADMSVIAAVNAQASANRLIDGFRHADVQTAANHLTEGFKYADVQAFLETAKAAVEQAQELQSIASKLKDITEQ